MAGARRRAARRRAGDEPLFLPRPRHAQRHHPASGAGGAVSTAAAQDAGQPLQRSAHIGALTDLVLCAARRQGVASIDLGFPMRYTHSALRGLRPRRSRRADGAVRRGHRGGSTGGLQPRPRRLPLMRHYSASTSARSSRRAFWSTRPGAIVASAARPHKMLVPQPGWAEHRPREDWWGDFCFLSQKLLADSGVAASAVRPSRPAPSARACCRSTRRASR